MACPRASGECLVLTFYSVCLRLHEMVLSGRLFCNVGMGFMVTVNSTRSGAYRCNNDNPYFSLRSETLEEIFQVLKVCMPHCSTFLMLHARVCTKALPKNPKENAHKQQWKGWKASLLRDIISWVACLHKMECGAAIKSRDRVAHSTNRWSWTFLVGLFSNTVENSAVLWNVIKMDSLS